MTSITAIDAGVDLRLQTTTDDAAAEGQQQAASDPKLQAPRQVIVDAIGASPAGAALLAEVGASNEITPADFSNMTFNQLLTVVMQGANAHAVADAHSIGDQLNASNEQIAELGSLSGQLSTLWAGLATGDSAQLPEAVMDELRKLGVSVPDVQSDAQTGLVALSKTQLDALVQNVSTQMQTDNGIQTELLQKLNQANNIVNELYDLFAKLTSMVDSTDSYVNQHSD
jgi:hypothetical protein